MTNNTNANPRRAAFLLRRVKAPHLLQVFVLVAMIYAVIDLARTYPLMLIAVIGGSILASAVARSWRRGTATATSKPQKFSFWDDLRTYQVWKLILIVCSAVLIDLSAFGVINI